MHMRAHIICQTCPAYTFCSIGWQDHDGKREEINSVNLERVHYLQSVLDARIEALEQAFETAHINYMTNTDQRTQDYKALMARGQKMAAGIDMKQKRIMALKKEIQRWRLRLVNTQRDEEERNRRLKQEGDAMREHLAELKAKLSKCHTASRRQLAELSKAALQAKAKLSSHLSLAERVLHLAERCRDRETEQEMVLPFGPEHQALSPAAEARRSSTPQIERRSDPSIDEEQKDDSCMTQTATAEQVKLSPKVTHEVTDGAADLSRLADVLGEAGAPIREIDHLPRLNQDNGTQSVLELERLDRFMHRYNRALIDTLSLEQERERLKAENAAFQQTTNDYLQRVSVSDQVLAGPNPLLVVNGNSDVIPVRARPGATVTLDANHLARTGRLPR